MSDRPSYIMQNLKEFCVLWILLFCFWSIVFINFVSLDGVPSFFLSAFMTGLSHGGYEAYRKASSNSVSVQGAILGMILAIFISAWFVGGPPPPTKSPDEIATDRALQGLTNVAEKKRLYCKEHPTSC